MASVVALVFGFGLFFSNWQVTIYITKAKNQDIDL